MEPEVVGSECLSLSDRQVLAHYRVCVFYSQTSPGFNWQRVRFLWETLGNSIESYLNCVILYFYSIGVVSCLYAYPINSFVSALSIHNIFRALHGRYGKMHLCWIPLVYNSVLVLLLKVFSLTFYVNVTMCSRYEIQFNSKTKQLSFSQMVN